MENIDTSVLSKDDIKRLLADRSTRAQMDVASKLSRQYSSDGTDSLTPQQQTIALDIFQLLLARGETIVRAMLAMNLSQTERLPPALARQMAEDAHIEVAGPVLQYSEALTDEDLAGIISSMVDSSKLMAIARRDTVSETVSDMLVSTNLEQVVAVLVQNEGAQITEQTFADIIQRHKDNHEVVESIFQRSSVPVEVIEKVISALSSGMRQTLEHKYGDLAAMKSMRRALDHSLEMTRLRMLGLTSTDRELMRLIEQLDRNNKLSPFSALSMCNLQLFEVSLSRILRVPLKNVHILLSDEEGFKTAYDRAQLPPNLREATFLAVAALRDLEAQGDAPDIEELIGRMRELAGGADASLERLAVLLQHYLH